MNGMQSGQQEVRAGPRVAAGNDHGQAKMILLIQPFPCFPGFRHLAQHCTAIAKLSGFDFDSGQLVLDLDLLGWFGFRGIRSWLHRELGIQRVGELLLLFGDGVRFAFDPLYLTSQGGLHRAPGGRVWVDRVCQ